MITADCRKGGQGRCKEAVAVKDRESRYWGPEEFPSLPGSTPGGRSVDPLSGWLALALVFQKKLIYLLIEQMCEGCSLCVRPGVLIGGGKPVLKELCVLGTGMPSFPKQTLSFAAGGRRGGGCVPGSGGHAFHTMVGPGFL